MVMENHNIKNKTQVNIPNLVVIFDKSVCLTFLHGVSQNISFICEIQYSLYWHLKI